MKKIHFFIPFFVCVLCLSCNKDELSAPASTSAELPENSKVLYFNSEDDFNETLQKVASMSEEERVKWEASQNFKSYHTLSSAYYENLDVESFQNMDDLKKLAGENQYVQLVENDGELFLECELYQNSKKFVSNADRLYQIAGTVYKVFENDVAYTSVENIELLKQTGSLENLDPSIQVEERGNAIKRLASTSDLWDSSNKVDGRDRTYMYITLELLPSNPPQKKIRMWWEIRPYKKTLGVWFYCTRTCLISWNVQIQTNDWQYYTLSGNQSKYTQLFTDRDEVLVSNSVSSFSLRSCNITGWSNSTSGNKCQLTWLNNKL